MLNKERIKELLKDVDSISSEKVNEIYKEIQKEGTQEEPLISKLKQKLVKVCKKRLLKKMKTTENITGYLEFKLIHEDPKLRVLKSKWARKRGLSFEIELKDLLNKVFQTEQIRGIVYRNHVSKFEAQPFDLVFYSKLAPTTFFECKASGMKRLKNGTYTLTANTRRYQNVYYHMNQVKEFLYYSGKVLYFIFLNDEECSAYFVNSSIVYANLPELFTKRVPISEGSFFKLTYPDLKKEEVVRLLQYLSKNA